MALNTDKKLYSYLFSFLFFIDSFLLGFRAVFEYSNYPNSNLFKIIPVFVWGTILILIVFQQYRIKELIISLILIILGLKIYFNAKTTIPLFSLLFVIGSRHKNQRNIIFSNFIGVLVAYIYIIGLSCIKVIQTSIYPDGSISLGFKNPNLLSFYSTLIIIYIIYIFFNKLNYQKYLLLFFFSFSMGIISKSRTGLLMSFLIICISICLRKSYRLREVFFKYIHLILILLILLCLLGIIFCRNISFFSKLDSILSGRFRLAQVYLGVYGFTPFGVVIDNINEMGYGHLVLDNGYARLFIQFGIFYFFVFLGLFINTAKSFSNKKDLKSIILIFAVFLGLVSETHWIPINTNIIICICSSILFPVIPQNKANKKNIIYIILKYRQMEN